MSGASRLCGVTDPTGDDNGPGSYVYPTNGAFNPGSFDLTNFDVYADGANIAMVARTRGTITNPFGGNGMSTQRLNVYVHAVDIISGPAAQSTVLNWTVQTPVVAPYVPLAP